MSDSSRNNDALTPDTYICHNQRIDIFKIDYKGSGWYEVENGWIYINEINSICYIFSWNRDPRPFFKKVADAEVRT